jgi:bile acid:Na+ symporter, BASS family
MDILLAFTSLTIFTLMLTIGINQSFEQLTSLWHRREELQRALLAVLVLVPAAVFVLLLVFDLSPQVATGLALLAAAPGAPLTTQRSNMVGADVSYVASLQLTMALLAIVVTPLTLGIFYAVFDLTTERVSLVQVAGQIASVTFLPVIVGLTLKRVAPKLVATIAKPLNVLANVLFLLLVVALIVVLVLAPDLRAALLLGWPAIAAVVIIAAAAVGIGHLLGGPRKDQRAGLAVASLARNIGLALFVASLSADANGIIPTLLAYMLLGTLVQVIYSVWVKRQVT